MLKILKVYFVVKSDIKYWHFNFLVIFVLLSIILAYWYVLDKFFVLFLDCKDITKKFGNILKCFYFLRDKSNSFRYSKINIFSIILKVQRSIFYWSCRTYIFRIQDWLIIINIDAIEKHSYLDWSDKLVHIFLYYELYFPLVKVHKHKVHFIS